MRVFLAVIFGWLVASSLKAELYVTLKNVETDRCASAWFIKRFVDPEAEFVFIETGEEPPEEAVGFDFLGAEYFHEGTGCTYTGLVKRFGFSKDKALVKVDDYVNDVYSWRWGARSFPRQLRDCLANLRELGVDDETMLQVLSVIFDQLYSRISESEKAELEPLARIRGILSEKQISKSEVVAECEHLLNSIPEE